jgi:hypothetical protein
MTEKNSSTLCNDLKQSIQLSDAIVTLRRQKTVSSLVYAQTVMRNIKQIPKVNPPTRTLHLSELAPTITNEEPDSSSVEKEQSPSSGRWLKNLSAKVRRKKR